MRNIKLILLTFALFMGGAVLQGCTPDDPKKTEEAELAEKKEALAKEVGECETEIKALKKEQSSMPPIETAARAKKQEEIDKKQEECKAKKADLAPLASATIKLNAEKAENDGVSNEQAAEDEAVD